VAGRTTFRILTSSQQSGIESKKKKQCPHSTANMEREESIRYYSLIKSQTQHLKLRRLPLIKVKLLNSSSHFGILSGLVWVALKMLALARVIYRSKTFSRYTPALETINKQHLCMKCIRKQQEVVRSYHETHMPSVCGKYCEFSCVSCVLLLVLSCLLCNCCWLTVCIVVVVLCVLLSYVYLL